MRFKDTKLWTWHIIAAAAILLLLGFHMLMMHLNALLGLEAYNPASEDPLFWENVIHRGQQFAFAVVYILLLAAALYHGLYGLRNILFEMDPSERLKKTISIVLMVIGFVFLVIGSWAAIAARTAALAAGL